MKPRIHKHNGKLFVVIDCEDMSTCHLVKKKLTDLINRDKKPKPTPKKRTLKIDGNILEEISNQVIKSVLYSMGGNKVKTARALGISIRCLRDKVNSGKLFKDIIRFS